MNLTKSAVLGRKLVRYTIYLLILGIFSTTIINFSSGVYNRLFPKPPPAPTLEFGNLPAIPFPERSRPENLNFTVETPDGTLPNFPTQLRVYLMPLATSNLFSLDIAKRKALALRFSQEGEALNETTYRFPNTKAPASLEMNIVTGTFSLSYDFGKDKEVLLLRPPAGELAKEKTKQHLTSAEVMPADLTGRTTFEYLAFDRGLAVNALSLSEAQLTKVNLFRKDYDKLPAVTVNPSEANVWVITSGSKMKEKEFVAGEFHYFPIDEDKASTYPIKTSTQAWEELKTGGGFIANLGENQNGSIVVRRIYLAYFDSDRQTQYYQPVIVFEGDRGFVAYVPAVTKDYYVSEQPSPSPSPEVTN